MANFFQITRTEFTVAQYIGWMRSGELQLNPNFQRRSVWKAPAKSYFIDTVARGLPIPIVFLRERTDLTTLRTIREVVDGQQRLRTLLSYIASELLPDFDRARDGFTVRRIHNKELGGKSFSELATVIQEQMISYQISTHVLPSSTSDAEVLDMFRRMNASGVKLSAQELRNAKFFGVFAQTAKEISSEYLDFWRGWRLFAEGDFARMREVEFVSELMMLIEKGVQEKTQPSIDAAYKQKDETFPRCEFVRQAFEQVVTDLTFLLGERLSASPFSNQAVFYALFGAWLDLRYGAPLNGNRPTEAKPIDGATSTRLSQLAHELTHRERLPPQVREALISRSNRIGNRKILKDFVQARLTNAGAN